MKRTLLIAMFTTLALVLISTAGFAQSADEQALLKLEEDFRAAKINNDVATLQRVLADNFYEVNWRGEGSNRATIIQIFANSKGRAIELSDLKVQVAGDAATVRGYQHETRPGMNAYIQFMHFCVRQQGAWRLLAIQQMMDYREGHELPKGWDGGSQSNHQYLIGRDTSVKRSGNASVIIKAKLNDTSVKNGTGIAQGIRADEYRGKRIRLSGYAKGENHNAIAFSWLWVTTAESELLAFDDTRDRDAANEHFTSEWTKFELVMDIPEKAASIVFGFDLSGNGTVWLDDWQIEVVGKDVPSTNQAPSELRQKALDAQRSQSESAIAQMKARIAKSPTAPVNLDFETPGKP